jgi:hypothetical protein
MPKTGRKTVGKEGRIMRCGECSGSGACDPCDGYGTYPDSSQNAGDGPECEICAATGRCPDCGGTGETTHHRNTTSSGVPAAEMRA